MKKLVLGLILALMTTGVAYGRQQNIHSVPRGVHRHHVAIHSVNRHKNFASHRRIKTREIKWEPVLYLPAHADSPTVRIVKTIPLTAKDFPTPLATVPTAAGISITVAQDLVGKFQGFIQDLVDMGYKPKAIGCYATSGHMFNSNHYHGGACDFDQTARNQTSGQMYHVGDLARKWGLRDGCSFHDCGHIDDGRNLGLSGNFHSFVHRHASNKSNAPNVQGFSRHD